MAPYIRDKISTGSTQISGFSDMQEAKDIAGILKAGELPVSLHQLRNLKVGDVLPFRVPDNAEVSVNGFPVFKADIGSVGIQSAVKITETVMAGDDNE